jgi:nucleotide-binding universal stress UspA family protein
MTQATATEQPAGRAPRTKPRLFQDLLVHLDESAAGTAALDYARSLAEASDGNVTALMLAPTVIQAAGFYGEATADVWLAAQRQAEREAEEMEARLREVVARVAPAAELRRSDIVGGDVPYRLADIGRYADATIIGWNANSASERRPLFNAALFHSGRPVIVVPEKTPARGAPGHVMVAWSPSKEAARALNDALPLMVNAATVTIVTVDDSVTRMERGQPGADIAVHLARHDIAAELRHVPCGRDGVTGTLLDESRHIGADLIVLGGYGHSRLSEWMLGGVTRDLLSQSTVPMLYAH